MTSVFSFWLQADNLEFGHINQVFFLLSTPVIFLMASVFSFCLRVDNLEFRHINQVLFFSSLLQSMITVLVIRNIWTETISIASFCVAIAIIEGIFFFQTKYVMWKNCKWTIWNFDTLIKFFFSLLYSSQR